MTIVQQFERKGRLVRVRIRETINGKVRDRIVWYDPVRKRIVSI